MTDLSFHLDFLVPRKSWFLCARPLCLNPSSLGFYSFSGWIDLLPRFSCAGQGQWAQVPRRLWAVTLRGWLLGWAFEEDVYGPWSSLSVPYDITRARVGARWVSGHICLSKIPSTDGTMGRKAWGGLLIVGIRSTRSQTQSLSRRCWKELRPKDGQSLAVPWPAGGTAGGGAEGRGWTPCPVLFAISTLLPLLFVQFLLGVEMEQSKRVSRGMRGQNDGRGGYTERVWGPQVSKGVGCVCACMCVGSSFKNRLPWCHCVSQGDPGTAFYPSLLSWLDLHLFTWDSDICLLKGP